MATSIAANNGTGGSLDLLRQLSRHSSGSTDTVGFSEELELLQNVYFDDLALNDKEDTFSSSDKRCSLLFHITPSTGDDKEKQYVYCDVELIIDNEYPSVRPYISIKQSRGLSDAHTVSIMDGLLHLSTSNLGSPMIYDLVEYVRDSLTHNNRPCGRCAICQWDFQDDDEFLRTECYHYFHPSCLNRYIVLHKEMIATNEQDTHHHHLHYKHKQPQELECPVCRVVIKSTDSCLVNLQYADYTDTIEEDNKPVHLDVKLLLWQQEMAVLYQKQLDQGGIIDLSAQDATIDENWVSPSSTTPQDDDETVVEKRENFSTTQKGEETDEDRKWTQKHVTDGKQRDGRHRKQKGRQWNARDDKWGRSARDKDWKHNKGHSYHHRETGRCDDDNRWRQGRYRNWKPKYEGHKKYNKTGSEVKPNYSDLQSMADTQIIQKHIGDIILEDSKQKKGPIEEEDRAQKGGSTLIENNVRESQVAEDNNQCQVLEENSRQVETQDCQIQCDLGHSISTKDGIGLKEETELAKTQGVLETKSRLHHSADHKERRKWTKGSSQYNTTDIGTHHKNEEKRIRDHKQKDESVSDIKHDGTESQQSQEDSHKRQAWRRRQQDRRGGYRMRQYHDTKMMERHRPHNL